MELSHKEIEHLRPEHRKCRERPMADCIKAILLLAKGFGCMEVGEILLLDDDTVRGYRKHYLGGGVQALLEDGRNGSDPLLDASQLEGLDAHLGEKIYLGVGGMVQWVRTELGKEYSRSGMTALIKRMGFVYGRPKIMPGKADAVAQRKFVEEYRELVEGLDRNDRVYFMDGAHPRHNSVAVHGRFKKGKIVRIPSNTGRKRTDINGAIDLVPQKVSILEDERINSQTVMAHLPQMLREQEKGKMYIILDNARYYRSKVVKAFLEEDPRVQFKFLPPYSPNLNIIERLWLVMKKEVVFNEYYQGFDRFREKILRFFSEEMWDKPCYAKFLTDNFHIIDPDFSGFDV